MLCGGGMNWGTTAGVGGPSRSAAMADPRAGKDGGGGGGGGGGTLMLLTSGLTAV